MPCLISQTVSADKSKLLVPRFNAVESGFLPLVSFGKTLRLINVGAASP